MTVVKEGIYKNIKSYILENCKLRAEFIANGSKMVSLIDKESQREFLWQNKDTREYLKSQYASDFAKGECSGFDEMFPTIVEHFYPEYPWKGVLIPDHGEVWSLEWDCKAEDDCLTMTTNGVRLPYSFEKKIYFLNERVLRIDYKLINRSTSEMEFIWAPHPLFCLEEGLRLLLPDGEKEVIVVQSNTGRIGQYGDIQIWPHFKTNTGLEYQADIIRGKCKEHFEKYYFRHKLKAGWCGLKYKDGTIIALSYPIEDVPYLGIWVNEGGFADQYNIALEPCTGSMDRIDIAKMHKQISALNGKAERNWFLNLTVDKKENIEHIDEEGNIC